MAEGDRESPNAIRLDEEVEGDRDGTDDFVFRRIGEPVPLKPSDAQFDLQSPPSRPLAVAERFRSIFLAHSEGFLVAKTKDVIELAKEVKVKGKGPYIEDASVVDVRIGRVSVLALSNDSSVLAVAVAGEIHLFHVPSLLNKDHKPSFSCSLKNSETVKDLKWQKNAQKTFIVLSRDCSLYHGRTKDHLENVMENVDAVDWSPGGDLVVVARKNALSIFSSDFKEVRSLSLLFQLWSTDTEPESSIKVDSIEWVREDTIIIGCIRINEDGNEEGYLLQVITSGEHKFTEGSCKPVVFSFPDIFEGVLDDILPNGGGPYLHLSNLDRWQVLITSNKKNIDQHVLLLKYSVEHYTREVVALEFKNDKYKPTIVLQENGDDNLILGFGIDKVSLYEKVKVQVDLDSKELSPSCVLFCLTCEGRLIMYHVARISDPSELALSDMSLEKELSASALGSEREGDINGLTSNNIKESISGEPAVSREQEFKILGDRDTHEALPYNILHGKKDNIGADPISRHSFGESTKTIQLPVGSLEDRRPGMQPIESSSGKSESTSEVVKAANVPAFFNQTSAKTNVTSNEVDNIVLKAASETALFNQTSTKNTAEGNDVATKVVKAASEAASFNKMNAKSTLKGNEVSTVIDSSSRFGNRPEGPSFTSGEAFVLGSQTKLDAGFKNKTPLSSQTNFSSGFLSASSPLNSKTPITGPSPFMLSSSKTVLNEKSATSFVKTPNADAVPVVRGPLSPLGAPAASIPQFSKPHALFDGTRTSKPLQIKESESELSKMFNIVKDMDEELDTLLLLIEKEGGIKDACTVSHQSSLLQLEAGLKDLAEISRFYKNKVEEHVTEIGELQSKMLQVSSRQVYMEGIVRQASDDQYWDIWNRQKLNPEFEQKRQHIMKTRQELTNALIELERHFNALEINRFGESSRVSAGRRAFHGNLGQPRQTQSLHSVYNTLNSQLAAAEQLSECLSKQMTSLNINPSVTKRATITRELFESIGLSHEDDKFMSPDCKGPGVAGDFVKKYSPSMTITSKEYPRKASSTSKNVEPESTRRDSLDRSWVSFVPQRTTVKRVTQQERPRITSDKPFRTAKEAFDSQIKSLSTIQQKTIGTSTSSLAGSFTSNIQPGGHTPSKGDQERSSNQSSQSQPNPVFKWAKDISVTSQTPESKSRLTDDTWKNTSLKSSSSSTISFKSSQKANEKSGGSDAGSTMAPAVVQSTTLQSTSNSRTVPNIQISATSSTISSFNLPSGVQPLVSTQNLESGLQGNKQQDVKIGQDDLMKKSQGSTKHSVWPPQDVQAFSNESNFPSRTLKSAFPSLTGQVSHIGTISKDQSIKISSPSSVPKESDPVPSSMTSPSSVLTMASVSTSNVPSVPATEVAKSLGPSHSSVKETNLMLSSSSSSPTSTQSLLPTVPSRSQGSLASTVDPPSPQSTMSELSPPRSNDVKFKLNATLPETPAAKASSFPSASKPEVSTPQKPVRAETTSLETLANKSSLVPSTLKHESTTSQVPATENFAGPSSERGDRLLSSNTGIVTRSSNCQPETNSTTAQPSSTVAVTSNGGLDLNLSQEDEMEEEAPDTNNMLNLGSLGGFGLGSPAPSSAAKPNPFGGTFVAPNTGTTSSPFTLTSSPGQMFRPPSFSLPSAQPVQPSQPNISNAFSGGNTGGGFGGFGQPAQLGSGQQALGSVLGAFGQSRQPGAGGFGVPATASAGGLSSAGSFTGAGTGGFNTFASRPGGFAGAATGGGFASLGSGSGGFAGAGTGGGFAALGSSNVGFAGSTGGGFSALSSSSGGFAGATGGGFSALASNSGGFAGAAAPGVFGAVGSSGGGFAAAASSQSSGFGSGGLASGGFGAFSSNQGGAFSAFGGNSAAGAARPPAQLFTQMRK